MTVARLFLTRTSLAALALALPVQAHAQRAGEVVVPGGVMPSGTTPAALSPSDTLAQNLRILAANPRDVTALTQAGISALAVGDPNAALGFLARAEQLAPTNGRVKAALGSVMVMMERPSDAMPFFRQALALGVPETVFASDRGLAFDLQGDPRAAQRDYAMVMRQARDPETVRRMALSLGVTGNKDQALSLLDPLIRQQDQAAWRARAFILAMAGDQKGADRIIQQVVPLEMVPTMSSFLRRLPTLNLAARASAVNFGTMPTNGPVYAAAQPVQTMRAIPGGMAESLTRDEPAQPALVAESGGDSRKNRRASRRRPGRDEVALAEAPRPVAALAPVPAFDDAARTSRKDQKLRTREERIAALNAVYDQAQQRRSGSSASMGTTPAVLPAITPPPPVLANLSRPSVAEPVPAAIEEPGPIFEISGEPEPIKAPARVAALAPRPASVAVTAPAPAPAPTIPPAPVVVPVPQPVAIVKPVVVAQPAPAPVSAVALAPLVSKPAPIIVPTVQPVVPAPAPVPVVASAVPPLVSPATVTPPAPAPSPVQTALVQAPPPVSAAPARPSGELMGPPSPDAPVPLAPAPAAPASAQPVQVAAAPGQVAAAPVAEPLAAAPAEAVTQSLPAAPDAAPVEEKGLDSLLDDLTPEAERPAGAVLGDAEFRKARAAAKKKADAEAKVKAAEEAEALAKKEEEDARKRELAKHPARYWVQVGTGNSKGGAAPTIRKVRDQAGDTLSRYGSATVPWKATQRLLVGPFGSEAEARKAVSALAKKGVNATTFASTAGQEVSKLATK